jgi:hypothetical protein
MEAAGSSKTLLTTIRQGFISPETGSSEPEPRNLSTPLPVLTETPAKAMTGFLMHDTWTILPDAGMEKCCLLLLRVIR